MSSCRYYYQIIEITGSGVRSIFLNTLGRRIRRYRCRRASNDSLQIGLRVFVAFSLLAQAVHSRGQVGSGDIAELTHALHHTFVILHIGREQKWVRYAVSMGQEPLKFNMRASNGFGRIFHLAGSSSERSRLQVCPDSPGDKNEWYWYVSLLLLALSLKILIGQDCLGS